MIEKVSVIVPAYNAAHDLEKLIGALKKQQVKPLEYMLIDDCSIDATQKIARSFFKVCSTPKNSGPAVARNLGMKLAKGDYFAFLDSDCRPENDWLENIEKCLSRNPEEDIITGSYYVNACTIAGKAIAAQGFPCGGSLGFKKMWQVSNEGYVKKISTGNFIIKRSVIEKYGGFDEDFSYCFEDAWFTHKLTTGGIKIKYCPEIEVEHAPREKLSSFIKWHYSRGKGLKPFKQRVGNLKTYKKLRLWSTKNIIKEHAKDPKLPLILMLLVVSIGLQYSALFVENAKNFLGKKFNLARHLHQTQE